MRNTNAKPGVWTLVGWGYNHPPNHPATGRFSANCLLVPICLTERHMSLPVLVRFGAKCLSKSPSAFISCAENIVSLSELMTLSLWTVNFIFPLLLNHQYLSVRVFIFSVFSSSFFRCFWWPRITSVGDLIHVLEKPVTDARTLLWVLW